MQIDNPIDFIKDLKSQHRSIIATISDIDNQNGGASNVAASVENLNKITEILFNHLEKEDKQLYPTLIYNKETESLGKKYYYDMERLSCMTIAFFKKYCVHNEDKKIFVEDFINAYSVVKGLLQARIKREETELYPVFILLQSGVLYSEVLSYIHEEESKVNTKEKNIVIYGKNQPTLDALSLALDIAGHKTITTQNKSSVSSLVESSLLDLVLIDLSENSKELVDLIASLKTQLKTDTKIIGFSRVNIKEKEPERKLSVNIDNFINNATSDIEGFSATVSQTLNK